MSNLGKKSIAARKARGELTPEFYQKFSKLGAEKRKQNRLLKAAEVEGN